MRCSDRFLALVLALLMMFGCLGTTAAAAAEGGEEAVPGYTLTEEEIIREDEVPLGAGPGEHACCILHFVLMLCALVLVVYYTHDQKNRQKRQFELRAALQ